jgi:hypothetical protein
MRLLQHFALAILVVGLAWLASPSNAANATAPAGMRLPFVGHTTWNTYDGHQQFARDIWPKSPSAWDGTVRAAADGWVVSHQGITYACPFFWNGPDQRVVIKHLISGEWYYSEYHHLSSFAPLVDGQPVAAGDVIGFVGSTGCTTDLHSPKGPFIHLHFQVLHGSTPINVDDLANSCGGSNPSDGVGVCGGPGSGDAMGLPVSEQTPDTTNPTISGSASPGPNGKNWNNTNVSVTFSCNDPTSPPPQVTSGLASCTGKQSVTDEGAGQSRTGTARDNANNTAQTTVGPINIDKTAPTVSGNRSPSPNAAGWYNSSPVNVTWKGSDNLSGVQGCDPKAIVSGEGRHDLSGYCHDAAGNVAKGGTEVLIDLTPPQTEGAVDPPTPNGLKGWYISPVTVTLTATDPDLADGTPGSGVAVTQYRIDGGPWTDYTGPFVVATDSPDHKVEWFSQDLAGNVEPTHEIHFRIDQTRPIFKVPQVANLWLCSQPVCPVATNGVNHFTYGVGFNGRVTDLSPKGEPQTIGSFEYEVRFDAKLVDVTVTPGDLFDRPDVTCRSTPGQGFVQFSCVTQGKPADAPVGPGMLANITVTPKPDVYSTLIASQGNGIATQLINQGCGFSDLQGHPIQMGSCDNAGLTLRYLEGDLNADCSVDVSDQQEMAFRWGSHTGQLLYNSRFDLEPAAPKLGDGDIDAKDLQTVFGRHGSTCGAPHPPQPPIDPKA